MKVSEVLLLPFLINYPLKEKYYTADKDNFPNYEVIEEELLEETLSLQEYAQKKISRKDIEEEEPVFDEEEIIDELGTSALPYTIGEQASEYLQSADDLDLYKVKIEKDAVYHFEVQSENEEFSPYFMILEYDDLYGWFPISENIGLMEPEHYIQAGLRAEKEYLILVSNLQYEPLFDEYSLTSKEVYDQVTDINESNDKEENATILNGHEVTGNFSMANDIDMYYLEPAGEEAVYAFNVDPMAPAKRSELPVDLFTSPIDPMVFLVKDTDGNQMIDEEEMGSVISIDVGWDNEAESGSFKLKEDTGYFVILLNYPWYFNRSAITPYALTVAHANEVDEDGNSVVTNNVPSKPLRLEKLDNNYKATGYINYKPNDTDIDWYELPAWKNSKAAISLKVPNDMDGMIEIFDKNGKLVNKHDHYGYGDNEFATVVLDKGPFYLAVQSSNGNPSLKPYELEVNINLVPKTGKVERISGATRYSTNLAFTNRIADHSLDYILLASGENFPDALAGGVLTKKLNATTLLVNDDSNNLQKMVEETKRLLNSNGKVIILGGTNAVSKNVETTFKKSFKVTRISGDDRTKTSIGIAEKVTSQPDEIFVVSGQHFADALSIVPYATEKGFPVLLNHSKTELSKDIQAYVKKYQVKKVTVVGGKAVVDDNVTNGLKSAGAKEVTRIAGKDRYFTALQVAKKYYPTSKSIGIANGKVFPDALSGSHFASVNKMPLLLSDGNQLIPEANNYLQEAGITYYYLYGGPKVLNEKVINQ